MSEASTSGLLHGKIGLIVGVANHRSIAAAIAEKTHAHGAEIAFTYENDRLKKRVTEIADTCDSSFVQQLDVCDDQSIAAVAEAVRQQFGRLDFLVHAVAFADRDELKGRFVDSSRQGFMSALDISAYSLVALARHFESLLNIAPDGNILTLSYLGAQRAVPGYGVMGVAKAALESTVRYLAADLGPGGIRVNALSAGPVRTLSASALPGFRRMQNHAREVSPLRRDITAEDIGNAAVAALSPLSGAMSGEMVYVDGGYHAIDAIKLDGADQPVPGASASTAGDGKE